jgi:chromate reductase, NAD(P)H dehydrogenase (quinone)
MAGVRLLGISGSASASSLNRSLLLAIAAELPADTTFEEWQGLASLPIFMHQPEPTFVTELKAAIARADGVIITTPEYNYSVPGGLKNALDWISTPPDTSPLKRKPIAMAGAATGMSGTIRAQTHLRQMLVFSDSPCMQQPEVLIPRAHERFDNNGVLTDESTRDLLRRFAMSFVAFVQKHQ